jgi:uncharacterized protein with HEPN domain
MHRDDTTRIQHMLESAYDARYFAQNRTRADLDTDRMLVRALTNCIEVIGEAASKLSKDLREQHPEIPWKQIINMRHRLIHDYFIIDLNILWASVLDDIPLLITALEQIVTPEAN